MLIGALEAGGTKMVCSIGNETGKILDRISFPTLKPEPTLAKVATYFQQSNPVAIGIGCFGPLQLDIAKPGYGSLTCTPKLDWQYVPILEFFQKALHVPIAIDTDVNAAALAEWKLGAARGLRSCVYFTVGTGIGGGVIAEERVLHGLVHPELGHMLLRAVPGDPLPEGVCPYHKGCAEGLACGVAIEKRWGERAENLPADHPAWELEAEYLAQLCMNTIVGFSPERIVLGGGVMHQSVLLPKIREKTEMLLGGYVKNAALGNGMKDYLVPPALGDNSGAVGALLLGMRVAKE
ncbi:MAG: ROK family protein [Eubacteriales bacterium]|nr:ROK family protein [Eubacteriales bacterium]